MSYDRFQVQAIGYNEAREITALLITNSYGLVVFDYHKKEASAQTFPGQQAEQAGGENWKSKAIRTKGVSKDISTKDGTDKRSDGNSGTRASANGGCHRNYFATVSHRKTGGYDRGKYMPGQSAV